MKTVYWSCCWYWGWTKLLAIIKRCSYDYVLMAVCPEFFHSVFFPPVYSLPGTSQSPLPICPTLGSACASGRWCHPSRHRGSYNGPGQTQTPSCTAGAGLLKLSLGTAWSGILIWSEYKHITLLLFQGSTH